MTEDDSTPSSENEENGSESPLEGLDMSDIDEEVLETMLELENVSTLKRDPYSDGADNYYLRYRTEETDDQVSIPKELNAKVKEIRGKQDARSERQDIASKAKQQLSQKSGQKIGTKGSKWLSEKWLEDTQFYNTLGRMVVDRVRPIVADDMDFAKLQAQAQEQGEDPSTAITKQWRNKVWEKLEDIFSYYSKEAARELLKMRRENELLKMRIKELQHQERQVNMQQNRQLKQKLEQRLAQQLNTTPRQIRQLLSQMYKPNTNNKRDKPWKR